MGVRHDAPDSRTETVSGQAAEPVVALVLSHNKREATLRCVESVARLRYRPLEVVVVDNGSTDGTAGAIAAAHPGVRLVRSGVNLGAAGGRNHGLAWIRAHVPFAYVLFLDDDATVDERLLDELVAALRATPAAGMATPKAYRTAAPGILASAGGMHVRLARASIVDIGGGEPDQGQYETPRTVDSCVGFAVLARREAVERVGGFDEAFNPYGWEEVDFSLRLRKAGYDIVYVPTAVAYHAGGVVGRGHRVAAYERRRIANFVRLMHRHATAADWLSAAAFLPGAGMRLVFRYARRRDWKMLWAGVAGLMDDLRGRRDR
jgi:GT2 family glycosyltransferase